MIVQSYRRAIAIIVCITQTSLFSMNGISSSTSKIVVQIGSQVAVGFAKDCARYAWSRIKAIRGIDVESIAAASRLTETASDQLLPHYTNYPAHLAPETVSPIIKSRIQRLNSGDYSWPTCKPILFVGPPGTGKTENPKYVSYQSRCPLVCESASSLYGGRKNLATELIYSLFKRARYRSLTTSLGNFFKKIASWITLHGWIARKPSIIHVEEFNGLALAVRPAGTNSHDHTLESERSNAFNRFLWELNNNPHNLNMPVAVRDWSKDVPVNHIMRILLDIEPHLATVIPNYSCPPATINEKSLTFCLYKSRILQWICSSLIKNRKCFHEKEIAQLLTDDAIIPIIYAYWHSKHSSRSIFMWILFQDFRLSNWLSANDPTDSLVIATTNTDKDHLDPRVKRLFDIIEVKQPDVTVCQQILDFHAQGKQFDNVNLAELANQLEGFSPDRIAHIIRYAALNAASTGRTRISKSDIDYAYEKLRS